MPDAPDPENPDARVATLEAEVLRLGKVNRALMARVEREMDGEDTDFGQFRTSVLLEDKIRERTRELESALAKNEKITRALGRAKLELEQEQAEQRELIRRLEETHRQLVHSEKMASIGQLAAGVAHEINNPIGFVRSNLTTLQTYVADLLELVDLYREQERFLGAGSEAVAAAVREHAARIDLEYLRRDIVSLIAECSEGSDRVKRIVSDLRDFSRPGDEDWQWADIHAGLDSALNMVWNEIKFKADVVKEYGDIPRLECLASQLNQVFVNLLVNAAQAIEGHGRINIRTGRVDNRVFIAISDTGQGMAPAVVNRVFDPFFTTKPIGKGTGLGLSVSYGIVQKHRGSIDVASAAGQGSTFTVWLPVEREAG